MRVQNTILLEKLHFLFQENAINFGSIQAIVQLLFHMHKALVNSSSSSKRERERERERENSKANDCLLAIPFFF